MLFSPVLATQSATADGAPTLVLPSYCYPGGMRYDGAIQSVLFRDDAGEVTRAWGADAEGVVGEPPATVPAKRRAGDGEGRDEKAETADAGEAGGAEKASSDYDEPLATVMARAAATAAATAAADATADGSNDAARVAGADLAPRVDAASAPVGLSATRRLSVRVGPRGNLAGRGASGRA